MTNWIKLLGVQECFSSSVFCPDGAMSKPWLCYIIYDTLGSRATYVGATTNFKRRLRQHNGEIKGGAKATAVARGDWKCICLITGFQSRPQALQFEWALKHGTGISKRGIDGRMTKLEALLEREQWTKAAPPAWSVPLRMHWHEPRFRPAWLKLPPHVTEELTSATEHDASSDMEGGGRLQTKSGESLDLSYDQEQLSDIPQLSMAA